MFSLLTFSIHKTQMRKRSFAVVKFFLDFNFSLKGSLGTNNDF